ncbi:MAG: CidA/LrgA family protein [Tannerella sp.]|jgi:holin-like protein|nr:CidA/LrgA family protein [Tannerella sp.]
MIYQLAVLFGCLAVGEVIVYFTGIKIPSSIIGMLFLTLSLHLGWIKPERIHKMCDFLIDNMGFFFVPPGVALMLYFDIIKAQIIPITLATIISTILVLIVTGWVHQLTEKIKSNGNSGK